MQGEKQSYLSIIPEASSNDTSSFDVHEFLKRSICLDNHINPSELPFLHEYLLTKNKNKLDELEASIKTTRDPAEREMLNLQKGLFFLLDESKSQEEKVPIFASKIKGCLNLPNLSEQFKADLLDLETALSPKKKKTESRISDWTVVDTDHWEDMLLCGTEVLGSCQNINGGSYYNKCLLGYALDGKNRLIAVKDETGKIVARAIFRLLWDEKEKTPVLFLERIYQGGGAPSHVNEALNKMALKRSEAMGIPLASTEKPYKNTLVSLGSKAPFEYVDAVGHPTNGQYTIRGSG